MMLMLFISAFTASMSFGASGESRFVEIRGEKASAMIEAFRGLQFREAKAESGVIFIGGIDTLFCYETTYENSSRSRYSCSMRPLDKSRSYTEADAQRAVEVLKVAGVESIVSSHPDHTVNEYVLSYPYCEISPKETDDEKRFFCFGEK